MYSRSRFLGAMAAGMTLLFMSSAVHAATFTATSLNDLQTKLDSARDGDVINLQAKRYSGKKRLFVKNAVTIRGRGKSTIIDGELQITINGDGATIDNINFD